MQSQTTCFMGGMSLSVCRAAANKFEVAAEDTSRTSSSEVSSRNAVVKQFEVYQSYIRRASLSSVVAVANNVSKFHTGSSLSSVSSQNAVDSCKVFHCQSQSPKRQAAPVWLKKKTECCALCFRNELSTSLILDQEDDSLACETVMNRASEH